jgi:diguanylate cyclase (GGDEF)-like protein/PAS domain S-box-containing protein
MSIKAILFARYFTKVHTNIAMESGLDVGKDKIKSAGHRNNTEDCGQHLAPLYQVMGEINQAIIQMKTSDKYFPLVCRTLAGLSGMSMASIGYLADGGFILPLAIYGMHNPSIASDLDFLAASSPIATALHHHQTMIINDYRNDATTTHWRSDAARLGLASIAAFPIRRNGSAYAALIVCNAHINAFDQNTIALLEQIALSLSFALDAFERERQSKAADESLQLGDLIFKMSREAIVITDANNLIVTVNPAFTEITGYLREEVIGRNPRILKSGRHDDAFYKTMWQELNNTGRWQGAIFDQRKNGEVYLKWLTINTMCNDDGTLRNRVAMFTDINQKNDTDNLIWRQANFDCLTQLPNRQMFYDRLHHEVKRSNRTQQPFALLLLDLDYFKEVNDTLGHDMGDALLVETANRLTDCVRETDMVARLGGDEFVIILSDVSDMRAIDRVGEKILQQLRQPYLLKEKVANISASIGIAFYPNDTNDMHQLIKHADEAMYAAKSQGRNRCSNFQS